MFQDPFGGFGLPVLNQQIAQFAHTFGFLALPLHAHEIVISFIVYNTAFGLSGGLSPLIWPGYKALSERNQRGFDIHVVSMLNCLILINIALPVFGDPILDANHITGYTPYAGFVCAFAVGYFIWDTYICLRYSKMFGLSFALHGISSMAVFCLGLRPFLLRWVPYFLMFELSTPFVNMHWFIGHMPANTFPSWLRVYNGLALIVTFFSVRIVWGFYNAYFLCMDMFSEAALELQPFYASVLICVCNMFLNLLNVFWFSKMVRLAVRTLTKKTD